VKRSIIAIVVVCMALAGCGKRETAVSDTAGETIAPAQPQPAPTGTDAMTQTVDIEKGRSEGEGRSDNGADLTGTNSDTAVTGATPATVPPPTSTATTTTH
jgi:hypothetical protein